MIKVSIIVPVYNVKDQLTHCLDSIINQTLTEIEIICVDDCSEDGCADILRKYAAQDTRITNIFHTKNLSTSQARKDGVLASHGKYIMFVDGDDFLEPNACEVAYNAIEHNQTDIVQYDVNIINCAGVSEARIESNQKAMMPYLETIYADNLLGSCWQENLFGFNLWNKIYKGDLCRKAFSYIMDGAYPKAQDLYAFFVIAFFAASSSGIEDRLYNYNFGIGVTGGQYLTYDKFKTLLTERYVYDAIEQFLLEQNKKNDYDEILEQIYEHFLNECVAKWYSSLTPELTSDGFHEMVKVWGSKEVICKMASKYWYNRSQIAEKMMTIDYFAHIKRPSDKRLTIAAYYRTISNGGAQRVVATLCNIWADLKDENGEPLYNVVLITDEQPTQDEYNLNCNIKRAFLPDSENSVKDNYRLRLETWEDILTKFDIDIVVTSMWVAPCTLWDMLCVKGHKTKPAFIIHSHNFCCLPYRFVGNTGLELTYSYQLCDGVVTLSECDRKFASTFSGHTQCIVNPITFSVDMERPSSAKREKNVLVWVGRIASEKQPLDAVYMMKYVVDSIPDAKLYMVGNGDENLTVKLNELIEELHLEKNVILTGFTQNVEKYYQKANIYISTSEYEGAPLTFCEAMSYELPVVSYDMPWLTFMQDGRGIIAVAQKRTDFMAKEVIDLLNDSARRRQIAMDAKQQIIEMSKINIGEMWKEFFSGVGNSHASSSVLNDEGIIYKYLSIYQQMAKNSIRNSLQKKLTLAYEQKSEINRKLQITYDEKFERGLQIKELKKQNEKLKKQKEEIENSTTFKVGKLVMFFPVLIKKVISRL